MADETTLDARRDRIGAAIAAARSRLKARQSMAGDDIGTVLAGLNDEVDQIVHDDQDAASREYDRIEARLVAEKIRIEDDEEFEDR